MMESMSAHHGRARACMRMTCTFLGLVQQIPATKVHCRLMVCTIFSKTSLTSGLTGTHRAPSASRVR